jgi:hypothetical protein
MQQLLEVTIAIAVDDITLICADKEFTVGEPAVACVVAADVLLLLI